MALDLLLRRFLIHSGGIQLTTAAPAAAVASAAASVGRWGGCLSGLHDDPLVFFNLISKNLAILRWIIPQIPCVRRSSTTIYLRFQ